jgi:beta-galactosidase
MNSAGLSLIASATLILAACCQSASAGDRATINFDRNWRFHLGDVENGQNADFDDSAWRQLDVPHDWSIEGGEASQRQHLPVLNIVKAKWQFHRGDNADWKKPELKLEGWETVDLPAWWNDHSGYNDEHCYGWYRRTIEIPKEMQGKTIFLNLGKIDDCDQTFFNGKRIGGTGRFPPRYATAWESTRLYKLDPKLVKDGENVVAVRVYNGESKGGMYDAGETTIDFEGPFDPLSPAGAGGGYLDGGIGWYRKTFATPAEAKDRRVWIEFDGAYMDSEIWLNGKLLGRHPYGFTSFHFDLTDGLKPEGQNVLAVRLNVLQPCSRWYSGAGIFRHVRLQVIDPVHVAHWGTYVTTPTITADAAEVKITARVENQGSAAVEAEVWTEIIGPDGKVTRAGAEPPKGAVAVGGDTTFVPPKHVIAAGGETTFVQTVSVAQPKLWSPSSPELYCGTTHVVVNGEMRDFVTTNFGIRTVEFTKDRGMLINGHRVQVNGVCNHHDLGCLGSAVNHRAIQRQLEIMKGMGCNAIRTSHNPPDPALLEFCDAMGFVVMDEAFDEWKRNKTPQGYGRYFDEWSERDIVSMLRRDRNHPCIVLWSIGNEIPEQDARDGYEMSKRLVDICFREDPTRLTTSACSSPGGANRTGFARPLGVFGINYNIGAYRQFKDKYNLIGSETSSAVSTRDDYGLKLGKDGKVQIEKLSGHQVTSYDLFAPPWAYTAETDLLALKHSPWVAGEFVWTGFDYIGEPTPYGWPSRSSYFGIVDLAGFPKDRYYLYRSVWRPEPLVHLLPHWTWPELEGKEIPVWAVTNCDSVELFLNGKSLGEKKLDRDKSLHVAWQVPYAAGTLKAVAKNGGEEVATDEVRTAGKPARILLKPDWVKLAAGGDDLSFVEVRVVDDKGIVCPDASNLVQFHVSGPATIAGLDNGDAINHESFQGDKHTVFHGLGLVVVKAGSNTGAITVRATADGLEPAEASLESAQKRD